MSVLVDTDALIAVANTSLWNDVRRVEIVTTNVCKKELERHAEGRDEYLREGAEAVLDEIEDGNIEVVTSVPRPHGKDAGETSIAQEVAQNDEYGTVAMMDAEGREMVRRRSDDVSVSLRFISSTSYSTTTSFRGRSSASAVWRCYATRAGQDTWRSSRRGGAYPSTAPT